jgi:hypothetical protein
MTPAAGVAGRWDRSERSSSTSWALPIACRVDPARPHDVTSARLLLADELPAFPRLRALVGDRGYRGLAKLADRHGLALDIKRPPPTCVATFVPLRPLVKVEHAFAELGGWRRLSRCYEQTVASAKARLEVAAMGYLFPAGRAYLTAAASGDEVMAVGPRPLT